MYKWSHFCTVVVHTLSLYLIPSGVVFMQVLLGAIVAGYVVSPVGQMPESRRLAYLALVPHLLAAWLFQAFHPPRLTFHSYVELLLIDLLRQNTLCLLRTGAVLLRAGLVMLTTLAYHYVYYLPLSRVGWALIAIAPRNFADSWLRLRLENRSRRLEGVGADGDKG